MFSSEPITYWIQQLQDGQSAAAQRLWELYFQRMVELARRKLDGVPRAVADEEDVALSAFKSFCLGAKAGRFTQLVDRTNLWPLLMAITANKSVDQIRNENRQKRRPPENAPGVKGAAQPKAISPSELLSREPTPEFMVELADNLHRLLGRLDETGDVDLRRIALLKMDGLQTREIAAEIGCATRTIERKLQLIWRVWEEDSEN
jgi:DNA-directed RNA polymerase specialized sigma24 family protein